MGQNEFDEKYVKELRDEAAKWRLKVRELEATELYKDVEIEFARRGVLADPTWVEVKEGQTVKDAVDSLVEKHPNLAPTILPDLPTEEIVKPSRPKAPQVMKTNSPHPESPANPLHERSVMEIKKDPVARSKLRDVYRALLANSSNQSNEY